MNKLIEKINNELKKEYVKANLDPSFAYISISGKPELADYQINTCFSMSKMLSKNPFEIAEMIVCIIKDTEVNGIKAFSSVVPCKPGFVNLRLNDELLIQAYPDVNDIKFDLNFDNLKKCILLDYGGANVAKPLHVGHLRVAVIGETLKRLYNRFSIKTISDVHLGDFGLQMGLVIEQLKDENKVDNFTVLDLETIYPKASIRAKDDETFNVRAHEATKRLQDDLEPETSIWKRILDLSIEDLKKRYAELNVSFDYYYGESTVKNIMGPMVDEFIKNKIAYESDGAYVIDVREENDKKEMPPCIIRKRDGAVLYATSDIATIKYREEEFEVDRYVYVVDKRQTLHLEQCFRAARKANIVKKEKEFYHVAVGTMNGSDGKPFKSRSGGVVKLETLINEATDKALDELKNNNRDLTGLNEYEIARKIGIAALKYGDLSNSPSRDYIFDIDKFLSFQGNTGPYILYTIVRIKSIFEKLGDYKELEFKFNNEYFDEILHNILLKVIRYEEVLYNAYLHYDPSEICKYIYDLSNDYNSFYHMHNIINEGNANKKALYVLISKITDTILRDALSILAIDIPEKM